MTDAVSALRIVTGLHRDYIDWDLPEVSRLRVIDEDPHSWLTGAVTQVVRKPVGTTASGHPVLALGDTAISYDPIAGQGAQGGLIQTADLVRSAASHDGPFDTEWLTTSFEEFYRQRGRAAQRVTRLFLSDPAFADYGSLFFAAASASPRFAGKLVGLLDDPAPFEPVTSEDAAKALITEFAGEPADEVLSRFRPAGRFERSQLARSAA